MKLHSAWRVAALALFVAMVVGVTPVYAVTTPLGTVQNTATYVSSGGTSTLVQGMTKDALRQLVTSGTTKPQWLLSSPLVVTSAGKTFNFNPNDAVVVDVEAMVAQAYRSDVSTNTPYEIDVAYKVQPAVVNAWVSTVAKAVYKEKKDARRVLKKKRLKFVKERLGLSLDRSATTSAITASLTAALANPSVLPSAVAAPVKSVTPKVTSKNIGKAILVVLSERRIYLYKGTKLEKKYRCAVGTSGHATPTGNWKITAKRKNPIWRNPAPNGWGKNMPSMIPAGPTNPLGVRALNLNASGIRIHGTHKYWSIGHAASHGCMRMTNKDVKDLYPRVKVGTPVKIIK